MAVNQPTLEKWRPVLGYEGVYEVSDLGRVRSLDRTTVGRDGKDYFFASMILKGNRVAEGHLQVCLRGAGRSTYRYIHVLVLEAFVGPRPEGLEACHNNGDPADNRLENLRWDTRSSNALDRIKHRNHNTAHNVCCPRGHELVDPNLVAAAAREGRRTCLACARARAHVHTAKKRKGIDLSGKFREISDSYHEDILSKHAD